MQVKTTTVSDAREFFAGELKAALEKHQINAGMHSVDYLVELMVRYIESKNFFVAGPQGKLEDNFLVDLYAEFLTADVARKKEVLRRLGDVCLFVSGFFAESLSRKVVDIEYYFGMGGSAYSQLSQMQFTSDSRKLYSELSAKFQPFSNVLGEISEKSGIQSNKDILRLYERWLVTGSDRLRKLLSQKGIAVPFQVDIKTRQ
jgi:hypothetical protein